MPDFLIDEQGQVHLTFHYPLIFLAHQLPYLSSSWLWEEKEPRILVTGALGPIGRYLLHLLAQLRMSVTVMGTDEHAHPYYLLQNNYREFRYRQVPPFDEDALVQAIGSFRPHLIWHAAGWRSLLASPPGALEYNLAMTRSVCRSAAEYGVRRVILFTDGAIYERAETPVKESAPLAPCDPVSESLRQAEKMALQFHCPGELEIYSLRYPMLYGSLVPIGLAPLARLIAWGLLLGPVQAPARLVSLLHMADLALAAYLLSLQSGSQDCIYNVAGPPQPLGTVLSQVAALLPKRRILGVTTRLAEIFGIGYQEQVPFPRQYLPLLASACEHLNAAINQIRFQPCAPLFNRQLQHYLVQLGALDGGRLAEQLQWQPKWNPEQLAHMIEYFTVTQWRDLQAVGGAEAPPESNSTRLIFQGLERILQSDQQHEHETLAVPLLPFISLDRKSWRILQRDLPAYYFLACCRARPEQLYQQLHILWHGWRELLKFRHFQDAALFHQAPFTWWRRLVQWVRARKATDWRNDLAMVLMALAIQYFHRWQQRYRVLGPLLPELDYGFLLASPSGDIGLVLKIEKDKTAVVCPRALVDHLGYSGNLAKRLSEFRKQTKARLVIGTALGNWVADLVKGNFIQALGRPNKQTYLIEPWHDYHPLLIRELFESPVNHYLFTDRGNQVRCGLVIRDGKLELVSADYLRMVNLLLEQVEKPFEVAFMIREATAGADEVAFFKIPNMQRLLSEMFVTSKIRKVVTQFLESSFSSR